MSRKAKRTAPPVSRPTESTRSRWLFPIGVALIVVVVFLPALRNGFVSWDDQKNFLENPHYRGLGPANLAWMWSTFHLGHYVPLSWMTLGLDYLLWGMKPAGYHATSIILHAANTVLLFVMTRRLFQLAVPAPKNPSPYAFDFAAAFTALAFGVHPLRVESVVWITERRDVLSLFFYLLTIVLFLRAVDAGRRGKSYWLAVAGFACALLSKATAMTAPAILLLLDVYPLRRLNADNWKHLHSPATRRIYLELVPFAVLSLASIVLSLVALHPPRQLPLGGKVAVSAFSLGFYVWKTIVPSDLSPLYEMPLHVDPVAPMFLASFAAAIVLFVGVFVARKRWPGITAACLAFFVITLPMLGIVQNGPQIAADRYTYHAAPAIAMLAGAGAFLVVQLSNWIRLAVSGFVVAALAVITLGQIEVWHDSERLWMRVLEHDPESSIGHSAYASVLFKQDRVTEAFEHARRAVAIAPEFAEAHNDLGVGLARTGKPAEAIAEYRRALAIKPAYDEAENNWGIAEIQVGDVAEAIKHYTRAIELNPDYADAYVNLGNALVRLKKPDEAIGEYVEALRVRPGDADAHLNWGVALAQQGKYADAIDHFRTALAIRPNFVEAKLYMERANALMSRKPPGH